MIRSFAVLSLFLVSACASVDATQKRLSSLQGTYADAPTGYAYGQAFGHRTFTFENGKWTLRFTLALDPEFKVPVFDFRTRGSYQVLGPSSSVPGAYEADFTEDAKYLTLRTSDARLIEAFGFGACALTPNAEKDVSVEGCLGWKPVSVCPTDHDLLALTPEGGVRFGQRPQDNDLCTAEKRPVALTPAVLPTP
ncbi:MAG: hypothetical protein MUC96_02635 [Myxococcaceae bacterium]|jgi:hypothetical protein|nr:hypothetical protein [Myxococcaceae bacterium]